MFYLQLLIVAIFIALIFAEIILQREARGMELSKYIQAQNSVNSIDKSFGVSETNIGCIFMSIYWIFFSSILSINVYLFLPENLRGIIYLFNEVDMLDTIVWFNIVIMVAVVMIAINKKYYIGFTIEQLFKQYRFKEKLLICLILMMACIFTSYLRNNLMGKINTFSLDLCIFIWQFFLIVLGTNIIYRVIDISFSKTKGELKLLKKLYTSYYVTYENTNCNEKNLKGVKENFDYLFNDYVINFLRIHNLKMNNISFCSVYAEKNAKFIINYAKKY